MNKNNDSIIKRIASGRKLTKKQKKLLKKYISIIVVSAFIALAIICLVFSYFKRHKEHIAEVKAEREAYIEDIRPEIEQELLTPNKNSRSEKPLTEIRGVVIHYTANPGTDAQANRDYFESRKDAPDKIENKVSSHFIIGLHGNIIQCIPLTEIAYASNERNKDTISIECCIPGSSGRFNKDTYNALLDLVSWLVVRYDISEDQIIRHYDVTGKLCPKFYVKHPEKWETLKSDIMDKVQSIRDDIEAKYPY
ncbi:MAG: peptidoglycan recognition family protein [Lachnospiraceae bacterium]|jgi:N-acetylmuramoyl-L-alanine amidase|nr:peptidoglycan recognition family protein [Lachnospiraceae bacterium]MEE3460711.1 peptidoglycan recognition family protein [Lachnospiraceae bacterium]